MSAIDTINIRFPRDLLERTDAAAKQRGMSRNAYILETMTEKNDEVFLDKVLFELTEEQWDDVNRLLDSPPKENPGLVKLLSRKPCWEE